MGRASLPPRSACKRSLSQGGLNMRIVALLCVVGLFASIFGLAGCKSIVLDLSKPSDVARLYRMRCTGCHTLIKPNEWHPSDWPDILDEFGPRSGLTAKERAALEPWLIQQARR